MQNVGNAHDANQEAIDAMNRILDGSVGEDFDNDCKIIGGALSAKLKKAEESTTVKVLNPKTLKAARDFEEIIHTAPMNVQFMERFYNPLIGKITYSVSLPRVLFSNAVSNGILPRFAEIVNVAEDIDIGIEDESIDAKGMLYFDITFNVLIRA